jgi:uncharacterized Tic20 family protein
VTEQPPPPPPPPPPPGGEPPPGSRPPDWGQPVSGLSPSDERLWAMFAHLGGLIAAFVALGFLGPLIVLLAQGDKSAFVRRHAVEALNFQITLLILTVAGAIISVITFGFGLLVVIPVGIVVAVLALIWIIQASIKANNGEDYRYPLNIRLVK